MAATTMPEISAGARACYRGRAVLVTGAGGSIGAELTRQLLALGPSRLILLDHSEFALYRVSADLEAPAAAAGVPLVPVLGSAGDAALLGRVLAEGVAAVIHAAAYKHVPMVEANPVAGLENNVLAAETLLRASAGAGVARFVFVSSDKAVRPAGLMGTTKWIAEQLVQDIGRRTPGLAAGIVRFGNVLGSSGSVLPLFREQVRRGGPVTVTHREMQRYFMSLGEAVELVLEAGAMAADGEVFLFEMGAPVRILDLARRMIAAAGRAAGEIEIRETGLRPGEKLREDLTWSGRRRPTVHPKIRTAPEPRLSEIEVAHLMREVRAAVAAGEGLHPGIVTRYLRPPEGRRRVSGE